MVMDSNTHSELYKSALFVCMDVRNSQKDNAEHYY